MKFIICALIVKALSLVGRILGKGTDKPGKIVLKLYPHIMKKLKFTGKVLAITGSNGKTTTANVVAHVLKESGCKVVNNELGSNMTSGVATTLLEACTLTGKVKADFVVLEVDEAYSRFIFEDLPIDYYLVLNLLRDSFNNTTYHVYAAVAPAVASQFGHVKVGQVFAGIKELGFYDVVEAAIGGDMVAIAETEEFAHTIEEKKWKTTSCCPAFVDYVRKNHPNLMDHVSTTVSPMIAMGRAIKAKDPLAKVVFIGPCTAKKVEIKQPDVQGVIDYVLTFEELRAMFDGKNLELENLEEIKAGEPSSYGRIFARTGGVAESVRRVAKLEGLDVEINPLRCDGIDECIKALKLASFGKLPENLIEGMACKGGCTNGAASIFHDNRGIQRVNTFSREALTDDPTEGIRGYQMDQVNMERDFEQE